MERKHKLYASLIGAGVALFATVLATRGVHDSFIYNIKTNASDGYTMSLSSLNAYNGESTETKYTDRGSEINFEFNGCSKASSNFVSISSSGYFKNSSPLHSITSITPIFSKGSEDSKLIVKASYDNTKWGESAVLTSGSDFDFNSKPHYLQFGAENGDVTVERIAFTFECTGQEPEKVSYKRVTSELEDYSGQYLIVYNGGSLAFNGSLDTSGLTGVNNNASVTIVNDEIESNSTTDSYSFTFSNSSTTTGKYNIKSSSGYYIGLTSNANNILASATEKYDNEVCYSSNDDGYIKSSGGAILRFNNASDQNRFRYYKSGTYTSQQPLTLYKLTGSSDPIPVYDARLIVSDEHKDLYCAGETFDSLIGSTGMNVSLLKSDGTETELTTSDYTYSVKDSNNVTFDTSKAFTTAGIYTVTVSYGQLADVVYKIAVTKYDVTSVSLNKTTLDLAIGGSEKLTATVLPASAYDKSLTWTSSDSSVAYVDQTGNVTGASEGTAVITVSSKNGKNASCEVSVSNVPVVSSIKDAYEKAASLEAGSYSTEKYSFSGTIHGIRTVNSNKEYYVQDLDYAMLVYNPSLSTTPSIGDTMTVTDTTVQNYNGIMETKSITSASITSGGAEVEEITITSPSQLAGTRLNNKVGVSGTLKSKSVSGSGDCTMVVTTTGGDITVFAKKDAYNKHSSVISTIYENDTITVTNGARGIYTPRTGSPSHQVLIIDNSVITKGPQVVVNVTGVTLSQSSISIQEGKTATLVHTVVPSNATNKNVSWTSSDSSVASVENGVVTANKVGNATITVTTVDGGFTATCAIEVIAVPVTLSSISVSNQKTEYAIGDSFVKPTVTAHYSNGTSADVSESAEFSGFNSSTAGTCTISVSYTEGVTMTASYTITVKGSTPTPVGDVYQISFKENGADSSSECSTTTIRDEITSGSSYIASFDSITKVYPGVGGLKFGSSKSSGSVEFTLSSSISECSINQMTVDVSEYGSDAGNINVYVNGTEYFSVSSGDQTKTYVFASSVLASSIKLVATKRIYLKGITLDCKPVTPIPVTAIAINPANITVGIGSTSSLSIDYTPADANQGKKITWSSNNTSVATVASDGTVSGIAAGNAVITATSEGGFTSTCSVTVKAIAVTGVSLSQTSAEISLNSTKQLSATVAPANATNKNVTWSTNKNTVATVDQNGLVTAKSVGDATITVTTQDGSKTATCTVTVTAEAKDKWTILMYVCGADLESQSGLASGDFDEITSVYGQPEDVNIVIQTGGAKSWDSYGINASYNQRYHVENRNLVCDNSKVYSSYTSMGSANTLKDFIVWGCNEYPAEKIGLILWNHGGGMRGVCYDEKKSDDSLLNSEVKSAVSSAYSTLGRTEKFEFIGYDACLMQVQDIADYNSQYFNYMVASEESEAGYGWDYDNWVDDLYAKKDTTVILKAICDSFIADNGGTSSTKNDQTLSYLNLANMAAYKTAWENMATALSSKLKGVSASTFSSWVVSKVKHYADSDYNYFHLFDAKDFVNQVSSNSSYNPGSAYTSAVLTAHSNLVEYSTCGRGAGNSFGLCVCYICTQDRDYALMTSYYSTTETNFTNWRSFCKTYGDLD